MCIGRRARAGHASRAGATQDRSAEWRRGHPRHVNAPMPRLLATTLAALTLAACARGPSTGDPQPISAGEAQRFSTIALEKLGPRCATASCHAGDPPVAFPQLDPDVAYGVLVGQPAQQASMNLVEPYAPESSYLVLKLRGTQGIAGGSGMLMPIGDAPFDEADIAAIEAWIANGAPND